VSAQTCSSACGYKDSNGNLWRESITWTFAQAADPLAVVNVDWIIGTNLENQSTSTNIQYISANVLAYRGALGLKASAVSAASDII
ncbi:hypothetical protein DFH07DRAFT_740044, partial [Mycena maculata]